VYDSEAIHTVRFLHAAIANPLCLDDIIPLEPRKMSVRLSIITYSFDRSVVSFDDMDVNFAEYSVTVHNPKFAEYANFSRITRTAPVIRVLCCNRMINLVFRYSLWTVSLK
jgi:hypothetical protein